VGDGVGVGDGDGVGLGVGVRVGVGDGDAVGDGIGVAEGVGVGLGPKELTSSAISGVPGVIETLLSGELNCNPLLTGMPTANGVPSNCLPA
jgi:hypothetical protein